MEDINEDSLSLFTLLDPRLIYSDSIGDGNVLTFLALLERKENGLDDLRLDLLVIGHGGRAEVRDPVRPEVILKMKKKGLNIEVIDH